MAFYSVVYSKQFSYLSLLRVQNKHCRKLLQICFQGDEISKEKVYNDYAKGIKTKEGRNEEESGGECAELARNM